MVEQHIGQPKFTSDFFTSDVTSGWQVCGSSRRMPSCQSVPSIAAVPFQKHFGFKRLADMNISTWLADVNRGDKGTGVGLGHGVAGYTLQPVEF